MAKALSTAVMLERFVDETSSPNISETLLYNVERQFMFLTISVTNGGLVLLNIHDRASRINRSRAHLIPLRLAQKRLSPLLLLNNPRSYHVVPEVLPRTSSTASFQEPTTSWYIR